MTIMIKRNLENKIASQGVKNDTKLKAIPTVILATSDADEDIVGTYSKGASCYITKPAGLDEFTRVAESIEDFRFTVVKYQGRQEHERTKTEHTVSRE